MIVWIVLLLTSLNVVHANERHSEHQFGKEEIIELPMGKFPDPECSYKVHRNDETGEIVTSQVQVGDPLYHEWTCDHGQKQKSVYCMMVHNCTVRSFRNSTDNVAILDEFGCSLFPTILPHVEYPDDLKAGLMVHAFSLDVDKAAIFFECNVKLLLKLNNVCRRPTCTPLEKLQKGIPRHRRHLL